VIAERALRKLALGWVLIVVPAIAFAQARLTVDGTEFVLAIGDGRTLRSLALVGARLTIGGGTDRREITIGAVEEDNRAVGGRVVLHHFLGTNAAGQPVDFCLPDAEGRSRGFPVPDGRGGFELACTSGAVGKCIRWGYRPWEEQPGGPPLRAHGPRRLRRRRRDDDPRRTRRPIRDSPMVGITSTSTRLTGRGFYVSSLHWLLDA
jgi:hypothetical protein